jgi:hypothetical protein
MTARRILPVILAGLLLRDAPVRAAGHGECEAQGLCIPKKTGCIATKDEHYRESDVCMLEGRCVEKDCKKKGHCCLAAGNLSKIMHVMVCGPCG